MTSTLSRAIDSYPNRFDPGVLSALPEHLQETIRRRNEVLGPGYTLIYREPVEFVSGYGAHLIDLDGNDYLDAYNNVPCVGHAHPRVVEAVSWQMAAVNTNTRYVQEALVDYAERLLATFPEELSKLSLACSGSEANDLAMRVARFHTGGEGIIVTRWAYHGITREVSSFSPSLGKGSPLGPNVRLIDPPDPRLVRARIHAGRAHAQPGAWPRSMTSSVTASGSRRWSPTVPTAATESSPTRSGT